MAMQSGAMVAPEKIPVQWYGHHQQLPPPHHQMDEREGFLMWLRGEFAAANAIIDALCHHLRAVGEPGEYDGVMASVQLRRCNWHPILNMQQYFSVGEVVYALQQVGWKRQQRVARFDGGGRMGGGGKEFRRGGRGQRGGVEVQNLGGVINEEDLDLNNGVCKSNLKLNEKSDGGDKAKVEKKEEKAELNEKSEENSAVTRQRSTQVAVANAEAKPDDTGSCNGDGSGVVEKLNLEVSPRSFVATEICDGKPVNIAEGLKLYEDLFNDSEIRKLNHLVSDLRDAEKRGQLLGRTFVVSKRPMKGHGREMIQFGVPIVDGPPEDEVAAGTSKDPKIEPIPVQLQDVIERLLTEHVVSVKPDTAIVDIFHEGDHSHPHIWPHWYGRPVCVIFLTVCELAFGKVLATDQPGRYRGSLQLSVTPGSMLVMQGRSADFIRHAINSLQKQRILLTLVKSQPRSHRLPSPSSSWAPPPIRSPIHTRPEHFNPIPPTGVLPQPMFVATPIPLPTASAGWPAPPPRHPPPRAAVPGTGVFLPPQGSGNSSNQIALTESVTVETVGKGEERSVEKSNGPHTSKSNDEECTGKEMVMKEEEEEEKHDGGGV